MKYLLVLIFLVSYPLFGQDMDGIWAGSLASPGNPSATLQSVVTVRVSGQQLLGDLRVGTDGKEDQYTLRGTVTNQQAQGTATYPVDGAVFQFETVWQNGQLVVKIGQNGNVTMAGTLTRRGAVDQRKPFAEQPRLRVPVPSADGLYRDQALIGAWRTSSNLGGGITDGGFYGSTSSTMILKADGTFGDGGSSANASGADISVQSSGRGDAALYAQLAGARWFTKGNLFCIRLKVNGKMQDVPSATYYVENGKALITDLKTGKKTLYYKAE